MEDKPVAAAGTVSGQLGAGDLYSRQPARHQPARYLGQTLLTRTAIQTNLEKNGYVVFIFTIIKHFKTS